MMRAAVNRHRFIDGDSAAAALAARIAIDLDAGIAARGAGVLAVSGGQTPKRLFEALSRVELDWSRVSVTLVDERCVPEASERSNARLVRKHLLHARAAAAQFVPLHRDGCFPDDEVARPSGQLLALLEQGFDAVVLGLGTDGHTASFFPGGDTLERAVDPLTPPSLVAMRAITAEEVRLTLTASALVRTRGLYLQMEDPHKLAIFEQATKDGPICELPIRVFLHHCALKLDVYECCYPEVPSHLRDNIGSVHNQGSIL
jgi:6-phosphogluconolactonase